MSKFSRILPVSIGSLVEHYDTSLYGFMAPLLIKLFFPNIDQTNAIILILSGYGISLLGKPLGAIIIGHIGDKYGRKKALIFSMLGMGLVTVLMGVLPTYEQIGIYAPILLVLGRIFQAFFVAGEYNGGAIYIVEHNTGNSGFLSGIYCSLTVIGIMLASLAATLVMKYDETLWRIPYFIGALTAIAGLYFRVSLKESPEFIKQEKKENIDIFNFSKDRLKDLTTIISLSSFSSLIYVFSMIMLNNFVEIISDIKASEVMEINTLILICYIFILPLMGYLVDKFSSAKLLNASIITCIVLTIPMFFILSSFTNLISVFIFKLVAIIICAAFYTSFHPWSVKQFPVNKRYTNISFGYSIGGQLGAYIPALSLFLFQLTGNIYIHALIIMIISILAFIALNKNGEEKVYARTKRI